MCTLMRRLREPDIGKLGIFFARNNRPAVTNFFRPFLLNENTAQELLGPTRRDLFFVMEENGRFLVFSMLRGKDEGYDVPSFGIFVDWEHQMRGLGRRMSEWTFRWADQMGASKTRLTVYEENIQARTLYERMGFIETERSRDNDGRISVIMHRGRQNSETKVFASTQALPSDATLVERQSRWYDTGIHYIELSNYNIEDEGNFLNAASRFQGELLLHHFFPANRNDVVLNLASDDVIRRHETFHFFQRSIEWSAQIDAPFFSFHAGYVTDPIGRDLHGFILAEPRPGDSEAAWDRFTAEVETLANHAAKYGILLLIENNVVTEKNRDKLLLATPDEFERFFYKQAVSLENVGILLDWGHWLVTANTYQLPIDSFQSLSDRIYGIHLHLNDGRSDEHLPWPKDHPHTAILRDYKPQFVTLEGHYQSIAALQQNILEIERVFA